MQMHDPNGVADLFSTVHHISLARIGPRTSLLIHARNGAAALGFGALVYSLLRHDQLLSYFRGNIQVIDFFRFAVYFYVLLLGVLWYYTGSNELNLLPQWLRPIQFIPKRPVTQIMTVLGIGFFVGVTFSFVADIWIFSIIYFFYLIFDIYTWRIRIDEIKIAIDGAHEALKLIGDQAKDKNSQETLSRVSIYETATNLL
jgi:hypothetical protein